MEPQNLVAVVLRQVKGRQLLRHLGVEDLQRRLALGTFLGPATAIAVYARPVATLTMDMELPSTAPADAEPRQGVGPRSPGRGFREEMLNHIMTQTSGDCDVIELDIRNLYHISGLRKAANQSLVTGALASAKAQPGLVDRDISVAREGLAWIQAFALQEDGRTFRVQVNNGAEFSVSLDELKTMLSS